MIETINMKYEVYCLYGFAVFVVAMAAKNLLSMNFSVYLPFALLVIRIVLFIFKDD
jgi:hypothetical protein